VDTTTAVVIRVERVDDLPVLFAHLKRLQVAEHQVRQKLAEGGETLKGNYPGQAGRRCERPSAELLLSVFEGISLTVVEGAGQLSSHVPPPDGSATASARLGGFAP
jgi:hypothetical protein